MFVRGAIAAALIVAAATPAAAQDKKPPYWASIASGQAMMRTGPARNYPGTWLYQRRDLPVRVLKLYPNWRLIEDPDGTRGWMLVTLLSDRRTAIVKPGDPRQVRVDPSDAARVRYLAEQGTVGRISKCHEGWCRIEFGKRDGYIRTADLWGVGEGETVE
jgi:SH3-like domain-containing protein